MEAEQRKTILFGAFTVLVTFIVFLPSLANGFVWDDNLLILRNANVQSKPLWEVWFLRLWDASGVSDSSLNPLYADVYRPWITFCYAVLFRTFGDLPMPYHALSVLVHLATTWMLYLWLSARRLSPSPALVAMATLVFAIHPSKVESVAWVSGSTDVWMGFFVLLILIVRQRAIGAVRWAALTLFFALALLSKETALVVLGWLLAEDYTASNLRNNVRDYAALAVGCAIAFTFRFVALSGSGGSLAERLPSDVHGLWAVASTYGHYLRQTLVFWDPAIQPSYRHYEPGHIPVFDTWSVVFGALFVLAVVALALRNLRKPPRYPTVFLGLFLFTLFLLPVSNLVRLDTESLTADRFLYLPLLGLSLILLPALEALNRISWKHSKWAVAGTATAVLLAFGVVSIRHTDTFSSDTKLRKSSLKRDPKNMYAMYLVAAHKRDAEAREILLAGQRQAVSEGRYETALKFALGAMRLLARETADLDQKSLGQLYRGYKSLEEDGQLELRHPSMQLQAGLSKKLQQTMLKDVAGFLQPYAAVAARTGRFDEAERLLGKAISISPNDGQLRADSAILLAKKGQWQAARQALDAAEAKLPGDSRVADARRLFERAYALHQAIPTLSAQEQALAKIYEPLAVADLRAAREAYLSLWRAQGASPPLLNAVVQVEIADRLPERAREALARARKERPDLESHWASLQAELTKTDVPEPRTVW